MKNLDKIKDIDFDALLAAAKAKHKLTFETCKAHEFDHNPAEFKKAQSEWKRWCKTNLTDRGIDMAIKADTGEPRSLFVVVAGSRF